MAPPPLIGLVGTKTSGKSTVADYLSNRHGFQTFAFADPLKRGLIEMTGMPAECFYGTEKDKNRIHPFWNRSGRQWMQWVGTDLFRAQCDDFWVRRMEWTLQGVMGPVCISDVRFQSEADLVARRGGILVRIERPGLDLTDTHSSETAARDIEVDDVLRNDGTLTELYTRVDELVARLLA